MDERPPLILLTGFLCSGKTSFLQHFIEYQTQRSRFVAVIQNEIGEIGLDGKLLDYKVTEIDEGCICCSLVGNLKRAVQGIFQSSLADCAIAAGQVAAADVLLLNKSDLVAAARLEEVRCQLERLNPNAPICVTCRGDLNPAMIFDVENDSVSRGRKGLPGAAVPQAYLHPTHAQDGLCVRSVRLPRRLDRRRFLEAVESVPASVFRIKGIVDVSDPAQTLLFQFVAGRYELSSFCDVRVPERFLSIIGKLEQPEILKRVGRLLRSAQI